MASQSTSILPSLGRRAATGWQEQAACTGMDPSLFFPPIGYSNAPAKKVCQGCPVRRQCLEYSLANEEWYGVWGGVGEVKRRKMMFLRKRKYLIEQEVNNEQRDSSA